MSPDPQKGGSDRPASDSPSGNKAPRNGTPTNGGRSKRAAPAAPVPAVGRAAADGAGQRSEIEGLHPPQSRGHSGQFIIDVIVDLGYASADRVEAAVEQARATGKPPEKVLVTEGVITADQLSRAIAERYGLDYLDLSTYKVNMNVANLLSAESARRYRAVPVGHIGEGTLLLAMADPANVLAVDDVQMMTGMSCRVAVAPEEDIDQLIGRLSNLSSVVSEAVADHQDEDFEEYGRDQDDLTDLRASANDAPVVKLVSTVLGQAVTEGASDIHFEPGEEDMRVRLRVDGTLYEAARVPTTMVAGVITRLKVMSSLDIAEKRVPQDGRAAATVEDHRVDLRLTTLPTQRGEGAAIRILDKTQALLTLDDLGMDGETRRRFETSIRAPYGAILVTGPTGSGKSTSLYAALRLINDEAKNIITIEDPVEYRIDGINQIGVNIKAGLDFATGLRSILRADPDIIMVGEVRDPETARIATEAALTGHLVLSTLHTNDAPGAISRLTKMGVEGFLTASAVECVIAQRLARRLCIHCRQEKLIRKKTLVEQGLEIDGDLKAHEPVGCTRCNRSGYRGRTGLYSFMLMTDEIKELTVSGGSETEIGRVAREQGTRTIREAGIERVRAGITSIEEVLRVTR